MRVGNKLIGACTRCIHFTWVDHGYGLDANCKKYNQSLLVKDDPMDLSLTIIRSGRCKYFDLFVQPRMEHKDLFDLVWKATDRRLL